MNYAAAKYLIPPVCFGSVFGGTYYWGGQDKQVRLGEFFNNGEVADGDLTDLLTCLVANDTHKDQVKEKCKSASKNGNNGEHETAAKIIEKNKHMEVYKELKDIYKKHWKNGSDKKFDAEKAKPEVKAWCNEKRKTPMVNLDNRLTWHMIMFCSKNRKIVSPNKKEE